MLSYDLHVHPGPSRRPRWGDGATVWRAASAAGLRGFVWKAHEEHTVNRCSQLPRSPVRAIASASLNPWADADNVLDAIQSGAVWLWGPTETDTAEIGWDLPLPAWWEDLVPALISLERPLVLATGHLGAAGRRAMAELARQHDVLTCSITHSLQLGLGETVELATLDCAFEVDAYTYMHPIAGRRNADLSSHLEVVLENDGIVYFTSDGGQIETGNPFTFAADVLGRLRGSIGAEASQMLAVENPAKMIARVEIHDDL